VRRPGEAELVAERVLQSLAHPLSAGGRDIRVSASIGIARAAGAADPDALLRNADLALHSAKELGRGRAVVYEPAMHRAAVERLELEGELRRAVMDGRLTLHYQPVVELATGRVRGPRRWCAGRTPRGGWCRPTSSSHSPSART
jgi:predicted signal transduction protein with EAL and GGDEF domain